MFEKSSKESSPPNSSLKVNLPEVETTPDVKKVTPKFPDNIYDYDLCELYEKYSILTEEANELKETNEILIVRVERSRRGENLGLSLSGNNDLTKTSVFICDIYPGSPADRCGQFRVGDQLLEVNNKVIYGRAHSNVTPIVKAIHDVVVYVIIYR